MTDSAPIEPLKLTLAELVRRLGEYEYWLGYDPPGTYVVMPVDEDSPVRCGTGSTPWEAANDAMPRRQVAPRDEAAELRAALEMLLNACHRGGVNAGLTIEAVERAEALIAPSLTREQRVELARAAWREGMKRRLAASEGQP